MDKGLVVLLGIGAAVWWYSRNRGNGELVADSTSGVPPVGRLQNLTPGVISNPDHIQSTIEDLAVRLAQRDRLTYDQWNYYLKEATGSYGRKFEDTGLSDRNALLGVEDFMKLAGLRGIGAINGVVGRFNMVWPVESQGTENVVAFRYRS